MGPPKICPAEMREHDLIWRRGFVGVIKDRRMRLCWVRVGPKAKNKCPYQRKDKKRREDAQRGDHVKETEIGLVCLQTKECQDLRGCHQKPTEREMQWMLSQSLQKEPILPTS